MNCGCNKQKIETAYIGDLPLDNMETMADYFLMERDIEDQETGDIVRSIVRTQSGKVVPNGNYDNVAAIQANNTAIEIPEGQVRAVYIANEGSANVMQYTDATHAPVMLAIGTLTDLVLVQNCGFVNIPGGHQYIIGQKSYDSADGTGEPTTEATSGRELFTPISATKLAVKL